MVARGASMAIASMWVSIAAWYTPTVLFCAANLIIATVFLASKRTNNHDHVHGDSSLNPISRVSSFLNRARSTNSSSYTAITTAESQHQYSPQPKTAKYSSLSRLAQSIFSPQSNGNELAPSEPERQPLSRTATDPTPTHLFERVKSIRFSSVYNENAIPAESDKTDNSPGQLVLVRPPSFLDRFKSFRLSPDLDSGATSTQPETVDTDLGHNPEHDVIGSKKMRKSLSEMRIETSDDGDVNLRRPETARERQNRHFDELEFDARADDFISRHKKQQNLQRVESLVRYNEMLNRGR